jgi:hypothetical protein
MPKRALFLTAATIIACGISNLGAQTPTFRTGIDLATFGVTVVDRKG